ncbi:MAG: NAD(P)/FAD-dependent oxidoreductase [Deltaproteobacteria bacterium]|nr:NAD(P)/FAD-dependent oxidoreductase [Deltaproteobacteria bacterium]
MPTRIAIIGAGVVGCAIAKTIASPRREIHVFEKHATCGEETTSRNSGVIHAGLYAPPASLKAHLCIEGNALLYEWCRTQDIPHKKITKIIVAREEETSVLEQLYTNALACGVASQQLTFLDETDLKKLYPNLKGKRGLLSKSTGIVDAMRMCQSFYHTAVQEGVEFHFNCPVQAITPAQSFHLKTDRGPLEADVVINAAGLFSDEIAKMPGIQKYKVYPWRGDYFKIKLPFALHHLIYPVRHQKDSGIGIHFTMDLQNQVFLGPDAEPSSSKNDYSDRENKKEAFCKAASNLFSGLSQELLTYDRCGIRPKVRAFDESAEKDFIIQEDLPGFINLIGIESPGLTASMAIAQYIKKKFLD